MHARGPVLNHFCDIHMNLLLTDQNVGYLGHDLKTWQVNVQYSEESVIQIHGLQMIAVKPLS